MNGIGWTQLRIMVVLLTVGALAGGVLLVPSARAGTQVSGVISSDTTWTTAGSPYEVTGNLGVDTGVTLTIQAGVAVQLKGHYRIQIAGRLVTQGTDSAPVTFTCLTTSKNCWTGIEFTDSQSGSEIDGAHIGYADLAIDTNTSAWNLTDSWLHHSNEGIHATGSCCSSVGNLSHNYISSNTTGVNVFFKLATFSLNTITGNTKGVFLLGEGDVIQNNNIYGNSSLNMDTCFFTGDGTVDATNNWWGTTDAAAIEAKICHHADDLNYPTVTYQPFASEAIAGAASTPSQPTPTPTPTDSGPATYRSNISLTLSRHLIASGAVTFPDGAGSCRIRRIVFQRKTPSGWKFFVEYDAPSVLTYRIRLTDRPGRYRAKTTMFSSTGADICLGAISPVRRHQH